MRLARTLLECPGNFSERASQGKRRGRPQQKKKNAPKKEEKNGRNSLKIINIEMVPWRNMTPRPLIAESPCEDWLEVKPRVLTEDPLPSQK